SSLCMSLKIGGVIHARIEGLFLLRGGCLVTLEGLLGEARRDHGRAKLRLKPLAVFPLFQLALPGLFLFLGLFLAYRADALELAAHDFADALLILAVMLAGRLLSRFAGSADWRDVSHSVRCHRCHPPAVPGRRCSRADR